VPSQHYASSFFLQQYIATSLSLEIHKKLTVVNFIAAYKQEHSKYDDIVQDGSGPYNLAYLEAYHFLQFRPAVLYCALNYHALTSACCRSTYIVCPISFCRWYHQWVLILNACFDALSLHITCVQQRDPNNDFFRDTHSATRPTFQSSPANSTQHHTQTTKRHDKRQRRMTQSIRAINTHSVNMDLSGTAMRCKLFVVVTANAWKFLKAERDVRNQTYPVYRKPSQASVTGLNNSHPPKTVTSEVRHRLFPLPSFANA